MQCIRGLFGIRTLNAVGFLKKQKYADVLCNEVDKYRSEYLVVRIHRAQARAKMAKGNTRGNGMRESRHAVLPNNIRGEP